jgi:hypothetical protein
MGMSTRSGALDQDLGTLLISSAVRQAKMPLSRAKSRLGGGQILVPCSPDSGSAMVQAAAA